MTLEGGCACTQTRYRLTAAPMWINCCHCTECQRQTGSAFVINAFIETSNIEPIAGSPEPVPTPTTSGRPHDIYRCPACHTALWSDYGHRPGLRFLRVGTMDQPAAHPPDIHIFTNSKLPWVILPADVPAVPEYYDAEALWPPASLARRHAALKPPDLSSPHDNFPSFPNFASFLSHWLRSVSAQT